MNKRNNINQSLKKSVLYNALGQYSNVVLQFIIQAVLARILTPAEFGVVAVVTVFVVFFNMLTNMGIGPAIIQSKDLSKSEIGSLFYISILVSGVLGIIFMLLGPIISVFYNNTNYTTVCILLGIAVFFTGITIIPQSLILKKQRFRLVNGVLVISSVIYGGASIAFALLGFSFYSIVLGNLLKSLAQLIIFLFYARIKIIFRWNKRAVQKIIGFSKNQFLFSFINYFSRNLDNLLIGRFISSGELGYYSKAYNVSLYPNQILGNVLNSAIQPVFSKFEDNLNIIQDAYLRISKIMAIIGIPISVFIFLNSYDIILFLYGSQWHHSVETLSILAISIWMQMINSSVGGILQSANRTDLLLVSGILSAVVSVIGMVIGLLFGTIETVAIGIVIAFTINFLQANYIVIHSLFKSRVTVFFVNLIGPVMLGLIIGAVLVILNHTFVISNVFLGLLIKGIVFVVTFIIALFITGQHKILNSFLKKS